MNRRGFSLLELLFALGLAGLLLVIAVVNLSGGKASAGSRALAESVAEELRQARKLAIAAGIPVAVAFPSGGLPCAQSLYRYQEEDRPQLTHVRSFAGDFPGSCVFFGSWGAPGTSVAQPLSGANGDAFNLAAWPNPVAPGDPALVFTPSGTVISTGLPVFGGSFHLGVASGLTFGGGSPANWSSFVVNRACKPFTITVTPGGAVSVQPGLVQSSGVVEEARPMQVPACAPPPPLAAAANNPPSLNALQVSPQTPAGAAEVNVPGGHLTLRVTASDPNGDRLYCSWAGVGCFSSASQDRMEWRRPPEGDPVPTSYTLTCTVRDQRGMSVTGGGQGQVSVRTAPLERVIYERNGPGASIPREVAQVRLNGTGESLVLGCSPNMGSFSVSPDGARLLFMDNGLETANSDGTGRTSIPTGPLSAGGTAWSPQGDSICWLGNSFQELWVSRPDGSGQTLAVSRIGESINWPQFSPDGNWLIYHAGAGSNFDIYMTRFRGGPAQTVNLTNRPDNQYFSNCARSGTKWRISYIEQTAFASPVRVLEVDPATLAVTDPIAVVTTPNVSNGSSNAPPNLVSLSPDGTKLAYLANPGPNETAHCWDIASGTDVVLSNPAELCNGVMWTPDSSRVIVSSGPFNGGSYVSRLAIVPASGGPVQQLTRSQAFTLGGFSKK